jgi:hypothetical protein
MSSKENRKMAFLHEIALDIANREIFFSKKCMELKKNMYFCIRLRAIGM